MNATLKNTITLLRLPFSVFLLPMSLFSFYFIEPKFSLELVIVVFVWHFLVFPSSNGYNSYHDRDDGPIGSLKSPPKPTIHLLKLANIMDLVAIGLSFLVNSYFAVAVFSFILFSRLYSNRSIRLKKYPVLAFFIVCALQGTGVFVGNVLGLASFHLLEQKEVILSSIACFFFIGTVYPITQIYQHESDAKDGVTTLSMILGKKGTFLFSGALFTVATALIYFIFNQIDDISSFILFQVIMAPSAVFFFLWAYRSFKDESHVNFKNTMIMLVLSALLNNVFFTVLLLK